MWHLLAAKPLNQNLHISSEPPPPPTSGHGIAPCTTSPPVCSSKLWANSQITPATTAPHCCFCKKGRPKIAKRLMRWGWAVPTTTTMKTARLLPPGLPALTGPAAARFGLPAQLYYYSLYQNFRMPSLFAHGCHLISNSGSGPVDEASIHAMHCGRQVVVVCRYSGKLWLVVVVIHSQYIDIYKLIYIIYQFFTTLKNSQGYLVLKTYSTHTTAKKKMKIYII